MQKDPFLSDKAYNVLKRLVQVYLPAVSALYFGLGQYWGFPEIEAVVGSIAVVSVFIGAVVGVNAKRYNPYEGDLVVEANEDGTPLLWAAISDEGALEQDEILMKVVHPNS